MTPEEAQATGQANQLIENNLSSVKIIHDKKGNTAWEIKVKAETATYASTIAQVIDKELRERYGKPMPI